MDLIQKMVQYFIRLRKQWGKHRKTLTALAAVVVFFTTYALILPAVTLDKDEAAQEPGVGVEQTVSDTTASEAATSDGDSGAAATTPDTATAPGQEDVVAAAGAGDTSVAAAADTSQPAAPSPSAGQIEADNGTYQVAVDYDEGAGIPQGASLRVTELAQGTSAYNDARNAVLASKQAAGENVSSDTLGLAALDIAIVDANGNEIEPTADAKVGVKITFASLPADASADKLRDSMEAQHIADDGTVQTVATVAGYDSLTDGSVEVGDSGATVSFDVSSFSTFTITWSLLSSQKAVYTVHTVDTDGNDINAPQMANVNINNLTPVVLADHAAMDGYEFESAHLGSFDGQQVTDVSFQTQLSLNGLLHVAYNNNGEQVDEQDVKLIASSDDKAVRDVYFVYKKVLAASADDGSAVKMAYDADAGLDGATAQIAALPDINHWYIEQLWAQLENDNTAVNDFRFYNVGLADGTEPNTDVATTITLADPLQVADGDSVQIVHFEGDGQIETVPATYDASNGAVSSVTFDADSYSIYGIAETTQNVEKAYRCTYTFQNDDGSKYEFMLNGNDPTKTGNETQSKTRTSEQIVKNGGQLLNVGVPAPMKKTDPNQAQPDSYGHEFLGWGVVGDNGQVDTNKDDLIKPSTNGIYLGDAISVTGEKDDNVTLRAVFSDDVYVTFHDVDNTAIIRTVTVKKGGSIDLSKYTAVPAELGQGFLGWSKEKGKTTRNDCLGNTTTFSVDTDLYPVISSGHWLRFDKNDSNDSSKSTYTDPEFIVGSVQSNDEPTSPTRAGWKFDGWYTDQSCSDGNKFSFNGTSLNEDTLLYAKWTPDTADYKVVFWLQDANDDDYSFAGQLTKSGTTQSDISYTPTDEDLASVSGLKDIKQHIQLDNAGGHAIQTVKLNGDDSTIVNVYYNRQTYTLRFYYAAQSTQNPYNAYVPIATDDFSNKNADSGSNGVSTALSANTGSLRRVQTLPSVPQGYERHYTTQSGYWWFYFEISGKYGQTIQSQWPNSPFDTVTFNQTLNLSRGNTSTGTFVSWGVRNGTKYYAKHDGQSGGHNIKGEYSRIDDDLVGTTNGGTVSGNTAVFLAYWNDPYQYNYKIYYSPLNGETGNSFTYNRQTYDNYVLQETLPVGSTADVSGQNNLSFEGVTSINAKPLEAPSTTHGGDVTFLYQRNLHSYTFNVNGQELNTDVGKNIPYGENVASVVNTPEINNLAQQQVGPGKKFMGWTTDPDGQGEAYQFTGTMPDNDIVLYAKIVPTTIQVTVDPNGGYYLSSDESQDHVSQPQTFTLNYGSRIDDLQILEDGTKGDSAVIVKALEEAKHDSDGQDDNNNYALVGWYVQNDDGSERPFNFDAELTENTVIKAHWKKAGVYKVRYIDKTGDTEALLSVDEKTFADQAEVTALAWPNEKDIPSGKQFVGWLLPDKKTVVQPGQPFTLNASEAIKVDDDQYYVVLTAMYTAIDATYITYNPNEGSGTLTDLGDGNSSNIQPNIPFNATTILSSGKGFSRDGYVLVGWNHDKTAASKGTIEWNLGEKVGVDGEEGNTLYAVWHAPLNIKKVDNNKTSPKLLSGATFKLTKKNADNVTYSNVTAADFYGDAPTPDKDGAYAVTTDGNGAASIGALKEGSYRLEETKAPDGYNIVGSDAVAFTVDEDGTVTFTGTPTASYDADTHTFTITNAPGSPLPNTGGAGTRAVTIGGIALIAAAAIGGFALRRKRARGGAKLTPPNRL